MQQLIQEGKRLSKKAKEASSEATKWKNMFEMIKKQMENKQDAKE